LNTVLQAAWAMLLGRLTGRAEVVFGVTVAGRPAELPGVERMVGLFINTLPLRLTLPSGRPLRELLSDVQERQSQLLAQAHVGLAEVQAQAGLGELFDALFVFENYPLDRGALDMDAGGLRLTDIAGYDVTHYPLGLAVIPGRELRLRLDYQGDLFAHAEAPAMGQRVLRLPRGPVPHPPPGARRARISWTAG